MISWKENGGLGDLNLASMSAMQSLAYNKYMQRGEFHLPNLKQIECGFWKDVCSLFYLSFVYLIF